MIALQDLPEGSIHLCMVGTPSCELRDPKRSSAHLFNELRSCITPEFRTFAAQFFNGTCASVDQSLSYGDER
jgi:hypothetical protein